MPDHQTEASVKHDRVDDPVAPLSHSKRLRLSSLSIEVSDNFPFNLDSTLEVTRQEVVKQWGETAIAEQIAAYQRSLLRFDVRHRLRALKHDFRTAEDRLGVEQRLQEMIGYMHGYAGDTLLLDAGLAAMQALVDGNKEEFWRRQCVWKTAGDLIVTLIGHNPRLRRSCYRLLESLLMEGENQWNLSIMTKIPLAIMIDQAPSSSFKAVIAAIRLLLACRANIDDADWHRRLLAGEEDLIGRFRRRRARLESIERDLTVLEAVRVDMMGLLQHGADGEWAMEVQKQMNVLKERIKALKQESRRLFKGDVLER